MGAFSRAIVLALAAFSLCSCRDYQRYKQLETYRMMSLIVGEVDRTIDGVPREKRRSAVQRIIERHARGGRDAWGNSIRFYERQGGTEYHYVIVSMGSDGRPDVRNIDEYFAIGLTNVHNSPASDIVFRDGLPITEAGK